MEKIEFKKVCIKNCSCYYFHNIIKLQNFDMDNIWKINEKSHGNILIYGISYKTSIDPKPLHIKFDKIDGFTRIHDRTQCLIFFGSEKMMLFTTELRHRLYFSSLFCKKLKLILMIPCLLKKYWVMLL